MAASNHTTSPSATACSDCNRSTADPGWIGAIVPEKIWTRIKPDGEGILCLNCVMRRCADAGLKDVPVQIAAGPLRVVAYSASEWFFADYEKYLRAQDKAPKTIYNYLIDVRLFAKWLNASGRFNSIVMVESEDIIRYRKHLQGINRRPCTINRNLVAIRLYFEWLVKTERILRNPAQFVNRVAQVAPKPRQLSLDEVERMEAAVQVIGDLRDETLLSLLRHTGLRASEACSLRWDALRLDKSPHFLEVRQGKGNKHRIVPLNTDVHTMLLSYRDSFTEKPHARLTSLAKANHCQRDP